jgi:hypothetical protein
MVGQTMGTTLLIDLVTGETVGMVGNGHEMRPLQEIGDFLLVTLEREYAYLKYSAISKRGWSGPRVSSVN